MANIFALKGRENELAQSISVSTKNRTGSAPTIVIIEPENSKVRGVEKTVYSMQELEDAKKLLLDQYETLGIVGVGFYGLENSLAIYVNDGADKNAITQASPVKNIVFREADSLGLGVEDTSDIPSSLPSTRAINALKGGDWLQRSSGSNWSTLTNSAIYAYGKSNQQIGFMTIGHGYTERQKVYHGGQLVGTATRVHYENYYDVAFIESPYRSYGYMSDGTTRVTEKTMPKSNLTVTAYRAKSGKASGKILDIDIDGYWTTEGKTKYFEEVFTTNISTQNGDSGACYVYGGYAMVGHLIGGYGGYSVSAGLPVYLTMETDIQPAK